MGKIKDITGYRYGKLVVLKMVGRNSSREVTWECKCDCGKIVTISGSVLRRGDAKSCGCQKENRADNLIGMKFGRLTVTSRAENSNDRTYWNCSCECGNVCKVSAYHLKSGEVKSCGCLRKYISTQKHLKHGLSDHPLFGVWNGMLERCYNENNRSFADYGGRGITVCEEWRNDFESFYSWAIESGYKIGLTIERINNNGYYSPDNCRLATRAEQNNNKRNNKMISYNGKTQSLAAWSREINIPYRTLISRLNRYGWDIERAFETK